MLTKRPLEPASSEEPTTSKARRLSSSNDQLLSLLEDTISRIDGKSLNEQHTKRMCDAEYALFRIRRPLELARLEMRERPVEEVLLPADLLAVTVGRLSPREMAAAEVVCRAFQAAVHAASCARVRGLGLDDRTATPKLTCRLLERLEHQIARAPALIKRLSLEDHATLQGFETCVLQLHIDEIAAHAIRGTSQHAWALLYLSRPTQTWLIAHTSEIVAGILAAAPPTVDGRPSDQHARGSIFTCHLFQRLPAAIRAASVREILPVLRSKSARIACHVLEVLQV